MKKHSNKYEKPIVLIIISIVLSLIFLRFNIFYRTINFYTNIIQFEIFYYILYKLEDIIEFAFKTFIVITMTILLLKLFKNIWSKI